MIEINNLTKKYASKSGEVLALDNINLSIGEGELICLLGHNGAGKTTLIKAICDLIFPTKGEVLIDRTRVQGSNIAKEKVGAVLEGSRNIYYYLTVKENLRYFGLLNGLTNNEIKRKSDEYLKIFELSDKGDIAVNNLSRGMQQKVAIMVTLMKNPSILLLDEPTLGLDIISSNTVKSIVEQLTKNHNKTIIVSTHDINLIENLGDRLVFLKKGKLVKDEKLVNLKLEYAQDKYKVILPIDQFNKIKLDGVETTLNDEYAELIFNDRSLIDKYILDLNFSRIEKLMPTFEDLYQTIME